MGRQNGKKIWSIVALCAMIGFLLLPVATSLNALNANPAFKSGMNL